MKPMIVDNANRKIILSSAFEKRAFIPGTNEYQQLQAVRRDFDGFELVTRMFRKNTKQDHHKGLTYDFMRAFIQKYEGENASVVLYAFEKMLDISFGHSEGKRYPTIKSWFLDRYPDYAEFGMTEEERKKFRERKASEAQDQGDNTVALTDENAAA